MSRPLAGILTGLFAFAGLPALAQTYNYTAKTESTVLKSGKVSAGSLVWNCKGNVCTITGPWASPGLSACQSLAAEVGRLTEYGHPKGKLSASQLDQCNKSAANKSVAIKINPNVIDPGKVIKPGPVVKIPPQRIPPIGRIPNPTPTPAPTSPPEPAGPELYIEEGSYQDYTLYVGATQTIEYHGSYSGPHDPLDDDVTTASWSGSALRFPAFTHTGADESGEFVFSFGSSRPDEVLSEGASGYFIEIPIRMTEIPQRVGSVKPTCSLSAVTAGTNSPYPAFPVEHQIGYAVGYFIRRDVVGGDWSINATARLPVILRPMMEAADIHTVHCQINLTVERLNGTGIDHVTMTNAVNRTSRNYVVGLGAAAGTPSVFQADIVLED